MNTLVLKTAAVEEPVSIDDFMVHARVDDNNDSSDVTGKLLAARQHVEDLTNRALISSTWQLYLERFPGRADWWRDNAPAWKWHHCGYYDIPLPLGNLSAVNSITYVDSTGATNTLDPSTYEVDKPGGAVLLADGQVWPTVQLKRAHPVCIEFVAGWDDAASVPQPLKAAIMLLAAHWYRNREAVTVGRTTVESMPLKYAVDALVAPYIIWKF